MLHIYNHASSVFHNTHTLNINFIYKVLLDKYAVISTCKSVSDELDNPVTLTFDL